jgi:hypothetical protein
MGVVPDEIPHDTLIDVVDVPEALTTGADGAVGVTMAAT